MCLAPFRGAVTLRVAHRAHAGVWRPGDRGREHGVPQHGADVAEALHRVWDTRKWFVSSQGHRISQRIVESGGGIAATAVSESGTATHGFEGSDSV